MDMPSRELPTVADEVVRAMRDPTRHWADLVDGTRELIDSFVGHGIAHVVANPRLARKRLKARCVEETAGIRNVTALRVRQAKRFRMDADFVRHVESSPYFTEKEAMIEALPLARLPFPTVWLEHEVAASSVDRAHRIGYLLERFDDGDPTRWFMSHFRSDQDGVTVRPVRYAFSTDGESLPPTPLESRYYGQGYRGVPDDHLASGLGFGFVDEEGRPVRYVTPRGYDEAVSLMTEPLYESCFGEAMDRMRSKREVPGRSETILRSIDANRACLRLPLALLATINHLEHELVFAEDRPIRGTGSLPSPVIRLVLGGKTTVSDNPLTDAVTRCLHDVRGHWRHYRFEDGSVRKRIWIDDHERGEGPRKRERSYAVGVPDQDDEREAVGPVIEVRDHPPDDETDRAAGRPLLSWLASWIRPSP